MAWPNFNRMYRERRLAALRAGRRFPDYAQAKAQLIAAIESVRTSGEVGVNEFWDYVFCA